MNHMSYNNIINTSCSYDSLCPAVLQCYSYQKFVINSTNACFPLGFFGCLMVLGVFNDTRLLITEYELCFKVLYETFTSLKDNQKTQNIKHTIKCTL